MRVEKMAFQLLNALPLVMQPALKTWLPFYLLLLLNQTFKDCLICKCRGEGQNCFTTSLGVMLWYLDEVWASIHFHWWYSTCTASLDSPCHDEQAPAYHSLHHLRYFSTPLIPVVSLDMICQLWCSDSLPPNCTEYSLHFLVSSECTT